MADAQESSIALECLTAIRQARSAFFHSLLAYAQQRMASRKEATSEEQIDLLRGENAYLVAEFFYVLRECGLNDPTRLRAFLQRHNADMATLSADRERLRRQGLSRQRVQDAIFQDWQIDKVVENAVSGRLRLDQSDLGRLLSPVMSPETCRKTVVALADGGLLTRIKIGQALITSTGLLEDRFAKHLKYIVEALREKSKVLPEAEMPSDPSTMAFGQADPDAIHEMLRRLKDAGTHHAKRS